MGTPSQSPGPTSAARPKPRSRSTSTAGAPRPSPSVTTGPTASSTGSGAVYSEVATFEILAGETAITLAAAEVNATAVECTGNLTTAAGLPVAGGPVLLRVGDGTLVAAETDGNGTYRTEIVLPAGEHTLRAEFHAAGYPLNASESPVETVTVRGEGLSVLPFVAALAAAAGTGWYLRRRRPAEQPAIEQREAPQPEAVEAPARISIAGLSLREAATVLFRALRARLGLPETKTPRDCARIAPRHAGFFERYERIRYAGDVPTDEEIQRMEEEALGGDEDAA